jgi:hypothetical protein
MSTITNLSNQCLNVGFQKLAANVFLDYASPINTAVTKTLQNILTASGSSNYVTALSSSVTGYNSSNFFTSLQTVQTDSETLIEKANVLAQVVVLGTSSPDNLLQAYNDAIDAFNTLALDFNELMTVFGYILTQNNNAAGVDGWELGSQSSLVAHLMNLYPQDQNIVAQFAADISDAFNSISNGVNNSVNSVPSWSITGLAAIQTIYGYIAQQATEQAAYSTGIPMNVTAQIQSLHNSTFTLMPSQYEDYLSAQEDIWKSMYVNGEYLIDVLNGITNATLNSDTTPTPTSTPEETPVSTPSD